MAVKTPFFIAAAATLAHTLHQSQRKQADPRNLRTRAPHKAAHRTHAQPNDALHTTCMSNGHCLNQPTMTANRHDLRYRFRACTYTKPRRPRLKRRAPLTNDSTSDAASRQ